MPTSIPDVLIFEPKVFGDNRGFFFESFNQKVFEQAVGKAVTFVQDNQSQSRYGVLRGLHYQKPPFAQGKLVRVIHGEVWDVCVDLRQSSPTFGKHFTVVLSAENRKQIWIPPGFAHGFLSLSQHASLIYKTTQYYTPSSEVTIKCDDPELAISWPKTDGGFVLSEKDSMGISFKSAIFFLSA
jgi:dTDP-4-dehydrorhamnose 3,5-epimerase